MRLHLAPRTAAAQLERRRSDGSSRGLIVGSVRRILTSPALLLHYTMLIWEVCVENYIRTSCHDAFTSFFLGSHEKFSLKTTSISRNTATVQQLFKISAASFNTPYFV